MIIEFSTFHLRGMFDIINLKSEGKCEREQGKSCGIRSAKETYIFGSNQKASVDVYVFNPGIGLSDYFSVYSDVRHTDCV